MFKQNLDDFLKIKLTYWCEVGGYNIYCLEGPLQEYVLPLASLKVNKKQVYLRFLNFEILSEGNQQCFVTFTYNFQKAVITKCWLRHKQGCGWIFLS